MNHLPYIVASYAIALVVPAWFGIAAQLRLSRTRKRLAAVDPRARGDRA